GVGDRGDAAGYRFGSAGADGTGRAVGSGTGVARAGVAGPGAAGPGAAGPGAAGRAGARLPAAFAPRRRTARCRGSGGRTGGARRDRAAGFSGSVRRVGPPGRGDLDATIRAAVGAALGAALIEHDADLRAGHDRRGDREPAARPAGVATGEAGVRPVADPGNDRGDRAGPLRAQAAAAIPRAARTADSTSGVPGP